MRFPSAYNSPDHDKIDLRACHTSFAALTISEETPGGNAVIQLPGSGNSITLDGVTSSQVMANHADYFLFT
jgi:hypothetical protein